MILRTWSGSLVDTRDAAKIGWPWWRVYYRWALGWLRHGLRSLGVDA